MRRVILTLAGAAVGTALLVGAKGPILASYSIVAGAARDPADDGDTSGRNCVDVSPSTSLRPLAAVRGPVKASASPRPTVRGPVKASASPAAETRVITGPVVAHRYGALQLQVTASGDRIVDVIAVRLPDSRTEAVRISSRAEPQLRSEALVAQSAHIATVSGATLTSRAYRASLQAALDAAAIGLPPCS